VGRYDIESLLRLYAVAGLGPARIRKLLAAFGSPEAVLQAPIQKLVRIPGIEQHTALCIKEKVDEQRIRRQLDFVRQHRLNILTCWDEAFPTALKHIYDAPILLFCKGDLGILNTMAIGIVGTRNPSSYGRLITEKFCRELTESNFTIISGLARGIDTIVHQTVLKLEGRTVAVLGSGMDMIYPPENRKMAERITEHGVLVSEYMIGTIPDPRNFPRRNRIISGLSIGVLVTEAGVKSGALITAYQALEQNREVFSVPGPVNSRKSAGANLLIKQGATLVKDTQDILTEIEHHISLKRSDNKYTPPDLTGLEKELYELLSDEPVHIDALAIKIRRTTAEVLSTLLTLELLGIVKQLSGKMFVRSFL
jgi:DNA processing protein